MTSTPFRFRASIWRRPRIIGSSIATLFLAANCATLECDRCPADQIEVPLIAERLTNDVVRGEIRDAHSSSPFACQFEPTDGGASGCVVIASETGTAIRFKPAGEAMTDWEPLIIVRNEPMFEEQESDGHCPPCKTRRLIAEEVIVPPDSLGGALD